MRSSPSASLSPLPLRGRGRRRQARVREASGVKHAALTRACPHPTLSRAAGEGKAALLFVGEEFGESRARIRRAHERLADQKRLDALGAKPRDILGRAN